MGVSFCQIVVALGGGSVAKEMSPRGEVGVVAGAADTSNLKLFCRMSKQVTSFFLLEHSALALAASLIGAILESLSEMWMALLAPKVSSTCLRRILAGLVGIIATYGCSRRKSGLTRRDERM